jgi:hypothetical protein
LATSTASSFCLGKSKPLSLPRPSSR